MRILITGGMSYIGLNTAKLFIDAGHDVVLYDIATQRRPFLESFWKPGRIELVRGDVTQLSHLVGTLKSFHVDAIVHLVTLLSEEDCRAFPTSGMNLGVVGTQNVLEAARHADVERFVYVSTGGVFGACPYDIPIKEDARPAPAGFYAVFKYLGEEVTRAYRRNFGMSTAVVRVSYVFGPDAMTPKMALTRGPIPWFLYSALKGDNIAEETGGDFFSSHSYVEDVAQGICLAAMAKQLPHDTYHIGSGANYSMRQVLDEINRVTGSEHRIGVGMHSLFAQTPMRGALDVSLAGAELGFEVRFPLSRAIEHYADWMRRAIKN